MSHSISTAIPEPSAPGRGHAVGATAGQWPEATLDQVLSRIIALAPVVARHARDIEQDRRLPAELMSALRPSALLRSGGGRRAHAPVMSTHSGKVALVIGAGRFLLIGTLAKNWRAKWTRELHWRKPQWSNPSGHCRSKWPPPQVRQRRTIRLYCARRSRLPNKSGKRATKLNGAAGFRRALRRR